MNEYLEERFCLGPEIASFSGRASLASLFLLLSLLPLSLPLPPFFSSSSFMVRFTNFLIRAKKLRFGEVQEFA